MDQECHNVFFDSKKDINDVGAQGKYTNSSYSTY
jgi:hypothetical protein